MKMLHLGVAASAIAIATASTAIAQDNQDDVDDSDVIVVTGSRLATDGTLEASGPVVAFGGGDIRDSGQIDIAALLRESPQLQASLPGSFSAFNGTPLGASLLNLRALGEERTLVLEDGRRHVAGIEGTAAVDVNTMSTALLGAVEVSTGGASSIYGADAVSGVVNFVMRDASDFDGLEIRTQAGVTDDGDAEEVFLSIANGFETADGRGSTVFAVEYQQTESILAGDRDFAGFGRGWLAPATGDAADPTFSNVWLVDQRLPISSSGGVIALGDGNTAGFSSAFVEVVSSGGQDGCRTIGSQNIPTCQFYERSTGVLRAFDVGEIYAGPFDAQGGDGVSAEPDDEILLPQSNRVLFQTRSEYELLPWMNAFFDAKFVTTRTQESNQVNGFNDDIPIDLANPFIPAPLRAQITQLQNEGIDPILVMSRDVLDATTRSNPVARRQTFRIVGGIEGAFEDLNMNYEVSFNYGRTDADISSFARVEDRYFAAIDAVVDPNTGDIVCRSDIDPNAVVPPASPFPAQNSNFQISTFEPGDGQCVPVNLFGDNSITRAAADFIFQEVVDRNDIEQRDFLATLAGDSEPWFTLPAGPIQYAIGYEWREEQSSYTPDALTRAGLTFGTIGSNGGPVNPSGGEYDVNEFFGEIRVPVVEGLPFAERIEVNGAYRYSDYSAFDETDTWNVGARWSIFENLTLRATQSRAVRVPNIGEAFAPTFTAFIGAGDDPCNPQFINAGSQFRAANCAALIPNIGSYNSTNFVSARIPGQSGGNPNLAPEEADTFTVGAVWQPAGEFGGALDGLIVTLDYYDIEIEGLIDSLSAFQIASNCVDLPDLNNPFCDAIDRDPTNGFITGFRSGLINLGSVETSGLDWRVDYSFDTPDVGGMASSVRVSSQGTHFLKNEEVRDPAQPDDVFDVLGEATRPEWIVNFNADWDLGESLTLGWRGRYESSQLLVGITNRDIESDPNFANIIENDGAFVHDFSVNYEISDRFEVYGGINNAFEEEPYLGSLSRPAGPRGRFFFIGLNANL
ncbi:TonB-dependent receptor domain-containing protein [Parvularcula lutaonensis]|uniref:TonB-dependent receptor domain-containing protein n=1 Tax=Parvularcula lutaonensis TaxID=491923 RepID=A0ABV7MDH5_9PROT|nr:TonB-dependent receptor [Parvularcula lutaonensis]GGY51417.1 TonB-dependent receptor [Parvularcula lutaonensis]